MAGIFIDLKNCRADIYRESSDNPILKAFCRVAPSLRFKVRAMLFAGVFFFACAFNVRTSAVVQARRFNLLATL